MFKDGWLALGPAMLLLLLLLLLQAAGNCRAQSTLSVSAPSLNEMTTKTSTTDLTSTLSTTTKQPTVSSTPSPDSTTTTTTTTTTINTNTTSSSAEATDQNETTTARLSSTTTSTLEEMAVYVASFFIIFGGVVPYIPQYRIINKTRNAHGFSSYVCLTIFISSILRILFWFGHKFEPALLIQSVVMIPATLVMLELCVRVERERVPPDQRNKKITDLNPFHFWKWTYFSSYLIFLSIIVVVLSLLTSLLVKYKVYVEIIGFISVIAEVLLSVPQFYRNYSNKSTKGMSVVMITFWIIGDLSKTIYFIIRKSPIQFVLCGCMQILINMAIICQAIYYSYRAKTTVVEIDVSAYNLMRY